MVSLQEQELWKGEMASCAQFCNVSKARKQNKLWFLFVVEFFNKKEKPAELKDWYLNHVLINSNSHLALSMSVKVTLVIIFVLLNIHMALRFCRRKYCIVH